MNIKDKDYNNISTFLNTKLNYVQEIIRNTVISIKRNKQNEIFSNNDANLSLNVLTELYEKTVEISSKLTCSIVKDSEKIFESLQQIIDKLSMIICGFGTKSIDDLLFISFGSEYKNIKIESSIINAKYQLIKEYIQPIGYKIIQWKTAKTIPKYNDTNCCNKITDESINLEDSNMFECFDADKTAKTFHQKIYGIRVIIQNEKLKKTLVINGIVEDIHIECFSNEYIKYRQTEIAKMANEYKLIEKDIILRILETITFKDMLIYGNEDLQKKMFAVFTEVKLVKQTKLDITIKKFLELDAYAQRDMLINLLIYDKDDEIQYVCYLLYDLITANASESCYNSEQTKIYESLPWKIRAYFKDIVKHTIKYTNDMIQKYEIHKITLEQQIYVMKASDIVKEKAMTKLKEIRGKSDELGLKAKQYLEGLIKIPFNIYKEEPILKKSKDINKSFIRIISVIEQFFSDLKIIKKEKYCSIEIVKNLNRMEIHINENIINNIIKEIEGLSSKQITTIIQYINFIKKTNNEKRIAVSNQSRISHIEQINNFLNQNKLKINTITTIYDQVHYEIPLSLTKTIDEISQLKSNIKTVEKTINTIIETLDESIYSHDHAKNQIMKIIGQWMSGEQTGYCFGFEGSPGVGKTSLAKKGLANCLKDENGISRPFAFIALGGSCNGSSIDGYGYTYMNSTWGKIVEILMETKCMNPIIYVDELDKVSNTENGKEIIGIFTHLIDSTQNESFQDKYFSGIDIDLSKALFIFSYNDPDKIDKVLLDRIHRVKFDNLSLDEKLVIVKKYIMPEINKKMGFENIVEMSDEIIEHIIECYTSEPGVRKLKEVLFDLYGEINLNILKYGSENLYDTPIVITKESIEDIYLKKYNKVVEKKIHLKSEIGIINGLWANAIGKGGIIQIQTLFFPSSTFLDLRLTGLQGDVMKESMNVAKSLAWNLTDNEIKKKWLIHFEETKCQGLHIHCPEGSVSKDGPSAGTAITIAIYSLLNKKPIKNDIAITGEINLNGEITAIGGLEIKISGGIKSGIKTFLYPKDNNKEYCGWKSKNDNKLFEKIKFYEVSTINDVFKYVFA